MCLLLCTYRKICVHADGCNLTTKILSEKCLSGGFQFFGVAEKLETTRKTFLKIVFGELGGNATQLTKYDFWIGSMLIRGWRFTQIHFASLGFLPGDFVPRKMGRLLLRRLKCRLKPCSRLV